MNKVHPDSADSSAESKQLSTLSTSSIQISKDLGDVNSSNARESEIESKHAANTESENDVESHEDQSEPASAAGDSDVVRARFYRIGTIHLV